MAGVVYMDWELASFAIGEKVTEADLEFMNGNITKLSGNKYLIPDFIPFQYGALSEKSRVHQAVLRTLGEHGIAYPYPMCTHTGVPDTPKDKEKDKEKDKDKKSAAKKRFVKPAAEEVTEYAKSIGFNLNGQEFINSNDAKGWVVGKTHTPMKDWRAVVRTWKTNYEKRKSDEARNRADMSGQQAINTVGQG